MQAALPSSSDYKVIIKCFADGPHRGARFLTCILPSTMPTLDELTAIVWHELLAGEPRSTLFGGARRLHLDARDAVGDFVQLRTDTDVAYLLSLCPITIVLRVHTDEPHESSARNEIMQLKNEIRALRECVRLLEAKIDSNARAESGSDRTSDDDSDDDDKETADAASRSSRSSTTSRERAQEWLIVPDKLVGVLLGKHKATQHKTEDRFNVRISHKLIDDDRTEFRFTGAPLKALDAKNYCLRMLQSAAKANRRRDKSP